MASLGRGADVAIGRAGPGLERSRRVGGSPGRETDAHGSLETPEQDWAVPGRSNRRRWTHIISQRFAMDALDEAIDLLPMNKIIGFGGATTSRSRRSTAIW